MNKNKNVPGRSLIKSKLGNKTKKLNDENFLHISELNDGYDWNRLNLHSVTEQDSFQEFLSTAELAGTEFTAEKLNVCFINPRSVVGLLSEEEINKAKSLHNKNKNVLKIPRRPHWSSGTTPQELESKEREMFLEWRRALTVFQEQTGLIVTPYEKNLDFWRQLWRVVERSDVLIQIVDARNPLLFRCEDLEQYVKEINSDKSNIILCNKADFLTKKQRSIWCKYFNSVGVRVVFFSATIDTDVHNEENEIDDESDSNDSDSSCFASNYKNDDNDYVTDEEVEIIGVETEEKTSIQHIGNSSKLFTRDELIELFRQYKTSNNKGYVTIGLVGYPNVGKSSTINKLLTYKKVPVSSTPGKTKHFQTVYLDKDILLCDCPGLVMPSFVLSKADMILNGILPIDHMRDHVPPINLLCTLIPRYIFENKYGIMIPMPEDGEDTNRPPFSEELLNPYAYNRGFMTANGQPDNSRAARYILKDFVNGKLLYCYCPPGYNQLKYHIFPNPSEKPTAVPTAQALRAIKLNKTSTKDIDRTFFNACSSSVHSKGISRYDCNGVMKLSLFDKDKFVGNGESKPWKNHKDKRNKHVKLRIKYRHHDE